MRLLRPRRAALAAAVSLLPMSAAPAARAGGDCTTGAGDCCDDNGSPGCDVAGCCEVVCGSDPFCCEVEWDGGCAGEALLDCVGIDGFGCGACGGPDAGACDEVHPTGGCDDPACCDAVCACDPFCCDVNWDTFCVGPNGAVPGCSWLELCEPADPCTDLACAAGDASENEPCGQDANGGCNASVPGFGTITCGTTVCGTAWADAGARDTDWFQVETTAVCTEITATLVSEFAGVVIVVEGLDGCTPIVIGETGSSVNCEPAREAVAQVGPGTYAVFVATAGFDAFPCGGDRNDYRLTVTCLDTCELPDPCGAATGDCCLASGTPGCGDPACCEAVCACDPYCCEAQWDPICAGPNPDNPGCSALALCGCEVNPACVGGEGDCCADHGMPGCDDADCCSLVCAGDPACCEVAWDAVCAELSAGLCQACTAPPCRLSCPGGSGAESEICGEDANGGCNGTPPAFGSIECGGTVCGTAWAEAGLRDTDWFLVTTNASSSTLTATLASEFDGSVVIVDGVDTCEPVVISNTDGGGGACQADLPATADVGAGTYAIFVGAAVFDGVPCDSGSAYALTVTADTCGAAACPADTDGDGAIGVPDLINVITLWGTDGQGPGVDADIDDDGTVGVLDVTAVIVGWGLCD